MPAKRGPCKRQDRQRTPEQRRRHGPRPWRAQRTRGGALDPGEAMKGYPLELRLKVLAAVDRGIPRQEVVRTFGIAMPTLERYVRLRRPTGEIGPPRPPGRRLSVATTDERCALWIQLAENDGASLKRHCEMWEIEHGERISVPTMWRGPCAGWDGRKRG